MDAHPLERDGELATLEARLTAALDGGTGSVALVTGPAGAGKTTVLHALAGAASARAQVLAGRAAELERELPFGVVRQLVEGPLLALPAGERDVLLAGPASPVRALLDAEVGEPAERAAAVAHGLYWLFARLADRQPLCVLVDDLHWADGASVDALAYVAHRIEGHPALIAGAAREDEPDAAGWHRLAATSGAVRVSLAPLSEPACAQLAGRELGAPPAAEFAAACHRLTSGNPRLLIELLAACREQAVAPDAAGAERLATLAPAGLGRMVVERISRLGDDAVALARAVAVLESARRADAAALAGLDDERAAAAIDRLVAAGVLGDALPLRFEHPLSRATVEADMTGVARDRAHRRAAALLAARDPAAAALHLLRCEPASDPWAVEALRSAARDAVHSGTPDAAIRLLDRALAEGAGPAVREELTRALLTAGDPRAAAELLTALAAASDPAERVRLAALAGPAQIASGDTAGGLATLRTGLAAAEGLPRSPETDELVFAVTAFGVEDPGLQSVAARHARAAAGDPRLEAFDAFTRFCAGEPATAVVERLRGPLEGPARLTGADIAPSFHLAIWALAGCDEIDAAEAALDRAFDRARERGSRLTYGLACFLRCWCRWRRGDVPGVLADVQESLVFAAEGWPFVAPHVRWLEAECALLRGDRDGCAAALEAGLGPAREHGSQVAEAWLLQARSALRLRGGDPQGALADALRCGELLELWRAASPAVVDWRGRAVRAALATGDRPRAASLAADAVRRAEVVGAPRTLAEAYHSDALTRDGSERIERLEEAATVAARGPSPLVRATVLADLGSALRRARRPRDAREPLRQALDLARGAGATALAEVARTELDASGARRRPERAWGVEALTPRERELARLAAEHSNVEIAERLFITRKTVESHLGAIYRKLDIGSRSELAAALARQPRASAATPSASEVPGSAV